MKDSNLENSRWMTEKEKKTIFKQYSFSALGNVTKDGIPVKQIDEFKGSGDNTIFIITVKEEKQYEMLQNMQRLGIENVLYLSDEVRYSL